ncbi:MAG: hypothetical protein ABIM74_09945 [candidate division WOR-3 bacterium]
MAELARIFTGGDEDTVCLMEPTYLRETEERLLVFAIYEENNPIKAYKKRMRIEHLFRDLKGLFGMREVLRRIRDPVVRKGLITLIMLAWPLAFLRGLYALVKGLLSQDDPLVREFLRGYISIINLAISLHLRDLDRLRSPCATRAYEETLAKSSICGGVKCVRGPRSRLCYKGFGRIL